MIRRYDICLAELSNDTTLRSPNGDIKQEGYFLESCLRKTEDTCSFMVVVDELLDIKLLCYSVFKGRPGSFPFDNVHHVKMNL